MALSTLSTPAFSSLYSANIIDFFSFSSSTLQGFSQKHESHFATLVTKQNLYKTVTMVSSAIFIASVGSLCWTSWQNIKGTRRRHKWSKGQPIPVVSVPGALPLVGHIFQLSQDSDLFIKNCKSKYGPIFRVQMPVNKEFYVITGNLIPEVLKLPERVASLQDALEGVLPVGHVVYKHYEHKCEKGALNDDKTPTIPIARKLRRNIFDHSDRRIKQAIDKIFHEEGLGSLQSGETKQIDDIPDLIKRTTSYMHSSNFYGTQSVLIDHKIVAHELIQVAQTAMRATVVYQILPYAIADRIVRKFISAEKHIDLILEQVVPVVNGIRSGSIPDDESTYMSMLMKLPVASDGSVRSVTETVLRVVKIFTGADNSRTKYNSFMLYELARRPKLVQELREAIVKLDQITTESLNQVPLIDSFLIEILRLKNHTFMHFREAKQDIILSTGHIIPQGSILATAVMDAQQDPLMTPMFSDVPLDQFDPYRYMNNSENDAGNGGRRWGPAEINQPGYYGFGFGMHPCGGRHFAVQEMKFLLAEVVTNYNIKPVFEKRTDDHLVCGIARFAPKEPLIFERI